MPQKEFIKNLANSFSATFLHLSMNVRFEKLPLDLFNESKKYLVKEKLVKYAKKLFLSAKMMFYLISYLWLSLDGCEFESSYWDKIVQLLPTLKLFS